MLPEVDFLKVNEEEVALLSERESVDPTDVDSLEQAASDLLKKGPKLVVVTLGKYGSYFHIKGGGKYVPAFMVETIDAIGCGDAFVAGSLTQLVKSGKRIEEYSIEQLDQVLRYANAVGALTSLKRGVIPALPTAQQVEEFINKQA